MRTGVQVCQPAHGKPAAGDPEVAALPAQRCMLTESPWKSGFWLIISAKMHPMDHTSTGVEYILAPSRISGARYHKVTTCSMEAIIYTHKFVRLL